MKRNTATAFLLALPLAVIFLSGCGEKGCTDPKAVNYNSIATEDDGSCIVCQVTHSVTGNRSAIVMDYNSASPHFNTTVALIHVRQLTQAYNNGICGSKVCDFEVSVQSLVNQNMSFNYQLSCSGDIYFNSYRWVAVAPQATQVTDTIFSNAVSNPCGNLNQTSLTAGVTSGYIYYW